ncbi:dihydropteroate synthase [Escherichia coli]|uniref:Dihydropteroate synthase n=1 Tax=Escherichia coli TaxID=562 RepID=A0A376NVK4_ECOLX|nr:dihydropteroate synthase [Escherichia coli]
MKLFAQGTSLDLSHPHVMGILNVTLIPFRMVARITR